MSKISTNEVIEFFKAATDVYAEAAVNVGLWESERILAEKYFKKKDSLLDVGCGAGRTTFGLMKHGYNSILGIDVTPSMIDAANSINKERNLNAQFEVADATNLQYENESYSNAIFTFNGLMQIPGIENRIQAMMEISRVLKPGGHFIFTSHDRDMEFKFQNYWSAEKNSWISGKHDPTLHEYGDRLVRTRHEKAGIYIHHPDRKEILDCVDRSGFVLVEDVFRNELVEESKVIKDFSGECRFWVLRKNGE